jgi:NAD(P)-dependent dehydrogenase (short-subunit alcohol dehydrogenase family)
VTDKTLTGRVALVTGASRGIGRALCLELARRGAHVIALARTQGGLEDLDDDIRAVGGQATLVPLDLKDSAGIDRLPEAIIGRWGRLDILVGNAGVLGPLAPLSHVSPKEWDEVFAVNVHANWRLIRALDAVLRQSDAGRVVMVSSGAARRVRAYWGPYAASKAALEAMTRSYAAETQRMAMRVMMANPGPLRTKMRAEAMPGEDPAILRMPDEFAPKLADMCEPAWTTTGALYDFPTDSIVNFDAPA